VLYQNVKDTDITKQMENFYAIKNPIIISWMRTLSDLRNLCAHHSRVWNRSFGQKGVLPKNKPKYWLQNFPELITISNNNKISPRNSLYFHIVIIWYFISQMNTNSTWLDRLVQLCDEYSIDMISLGFPENWQQDSYWDNANQDKGI
jgi:abortive infection bacteriophage resistance protein